MPTLAFSVQADYDKVIRLRNEVARLETEMRNLGKNAAPDKVHELEERTASAKKELGDMVSKAAQAGSDFEKMTDKMVKAMGQVNTSVNTASTEMGNKFEAQTDRMIAAIEKMGKNMQDNIKKASENAQDDIKEIAETTKNSASEMEAVMGKVGAAIAGAFAIDKLKGFVEKTIEVHSQMQGYSLSFSTMLGSAEKATAMTEQLVRLAATTPFSLQDVMGGAQQLMAFGEASETAAETLRRLGDIAAGTGAQVGQLTNVYGQIMAAGKMNGGDLLQFINAGVPIIKSLADTMGVAQDKVKDLISEGKVGFPEVKAAMESLTNEGGTFANLMEAQSHTLGGQISTLKDGFNQIFDQIGEATEGITNASIGMAQKLVDNYEVVGRVIVELIAVYGTYKAAVITLNAVHALQVAGVGALSAAETIHYGLLVAQEAATKAVAAAQALLNKAMLTNPYVAAAAAVAALVAVMYEYSQQVDEATRITNELDAAMGKAEASAVMEQRKLAELRGELAAATEGTKKYEDVKQEIIDQFGKYNAGLEQELNTVGLTAKMYDQLATSIRKATMARALDVEMQAQGDALAKQLTESLTEMQESLEDDYGTSVGAEVYAKLRDGLANGTIKTKLVNNGGYWETQFTGIDKQTQAALNANQGRNKANTALREYFKAQEAMQAAEARIRQRYQINDEVTDFGDDGIVVTGKKKPELSDKEKKAAQRAADKARKDGETAAQKRARQAKRAGDMLTSILEENERNAADVTEESLKKRRKQIDAAYTKQVDSIKKKARELGEANKAAGTAGLGADSLTDEQRTAINEAYDLARQQQEKSLAEVSKTEVQAMRDYIKDYGTYQEQKLAIAKEYSEKIAKAQSGGERLTLQRQQASALRGVENAALQQKVDWQEAFGGLTGLLDKQLRELLKNLQTYVKSPDFKNNTPEEQQTVLDNISRLQDHLNGGSGTFNFAQLQTDFKQLGAAVNRYQAAETDHTIQVNALAAAEKNYATAMAKGTVEEQKAAKERLTIAKAAEENSKRTLEEATSDMQTQGDAFSKAVKGTTEGLENVTGGLNELASGSLRGAFHGIQNIVEGLSKIDLGKAINDVVGKLNNTLSKGGYVAQIISAVLNILDVLKDGIGTIISSLIDTIFKAVDGILKNIITGKFIEQIFSSLVNGVKSLLNTVTFGGFSSWISVSGNSKEVNRITTKLTESNERLTKSIDSLKDEIAKGSGGAQSIRAAFKASDEQKQVQENTMRILEAQMGYHNAHHSNAYYWSLSRADYASLNKTLRNYAREHGTETSVVNSLSDLYTLSPEEMAEIRASNVEMWQKMLDQGKYNKDEYWENYADLAGQMEDITDALNEAVTGTTFDSMRDSFVNMLMDMDSSARDFSKDFTKYLTHAVLNAQISNMLNDDMQKFYEKFSRYMQTDANGNISEDGTGAVLDADERKELRSEWDAIVRQGMDIRDAVASFTGYDRDYNADASSGGFQGMSQDAGDELNGRFTALQSAGERVAIAAETQAACILDIKTPLSELATQNAAIASIADDTRDIINSSYLELIEIRQNTGSTAKALATTNERLLRIENLLK